MDIIHNLSDCGQILEINFCLSFGLCFNYSSSNVMLSLS